MATSGSVKTSSYDGRYYTVAWTATQNVTTNKSTITWTLSCAGGASSWYAERTLKVVVAGTTVYSKTSRKERYAGTIDSGTVTVSHNSSGAASFSISIQAAVYYSTVNCTGSSTFTLDTIPRKSTLSVANGTLNTAQTLTVTRLSTSFTHTIVATCGTASTTICTKSTSTSISFTPPIAWSSQNTTGTSVSVKYTITTYSGSTSIGSNSYTKTCSIPSSVKPTLSLSVSDTMGYLSTYGGYVQGRSKFTITLTAAGSYSSTIKSYKTTADGKTYTTASISTDVISNTGTLTISATVTDSRGRTNTASTTVTVLAYAAPKVTAISSRRCKSATDSTADSSGAYIAVIFDATVTSLNSKNTATYTVEYKKLSDTQAKSDTVTGLANDYSVNDGVFIFAADTTSTYDIIVSAADAFTSTSRSTTGKSISKLFSIFRKGTGLAVGKISEIANQFDVGWIARFRENVLIGNKTGWYDGNTGVYINKAGYMHIQRDSSDGHPYIAFIKDAETTANGFIRYHTTDDRLQFLNSGSYLFDSEMYKINANYIIPAYRVLYDNSTGTTGTVTLAETAANFTMLEIIVGYSDIYASQSVKIYSPNSKVVDLSSGISGGTPNISIIRTRCTISGTSITQSNNARCIINNGSTTITRAENIMYVKTVIGYR